MVFYFNKITFFLAISNKNNNHLILCVLLLIFKALHNAAISIFRSQLAL